jgi:iron complex outermembrane receptor protein
MLVASYSWNDSEYDEFLTKDANACALGPLANGMGQAPLCQEELDLSGNQFPTMPEHKVSFSATYYWNLLELDWSGTVSYFYTDDSWATAFNNPLYDRIDHYDRWDARVTAGTAERDWELAAFVRNIEDDREVVALDRPSTVTHNAQTTLSEPRTYGVSLTYNF